MSKYYITVTKTYGYSGCPENEEHFSIKGMYFSGTLKYYGNHGFDVPIISPISSRNNGYFWSSKAFMKALYNDELRKHILFMKTNEQITIEIEG